MGGPSYVCVTSMRTLMSRFGAADLPAVLPPTFHFVVIDLNYISNNHHRTIHTVSNWSSSRCVGAIIINLLIIIQGPAKVSRGPLTADPHRAADLHLAPSQNCKLPSVLDLNCNLPPQLHLNLSYLIKNQQDNQLLLQ